MKCLIVISVLFCLAQCDDKFDYKALQDKIVKEYSNLTTDEIRFRVERNIEHMIDEAFRESEIQIRMQLAPTAAFVRGMMSGLSRLVTNCSHRIDAMPEPDKTYNWMRMGIGIAIVTAMEDLGREQNEKNNYTIHLRDNQHNLHLQFETARDKTLEVLIHVADMYNKKAGHELFGFFHQEFHDILADILQKFDVGVSELGKDEAKALNFQVVTDQLQAVLATTNVPRGGGYFYDGAVQKVKHFFSNLGHKIKVFFG